MRLAVVWSVINATIQNKRMPVRKIPRNYRHPTGHISLGDRRSTAFEGLPEADFVVLIRSDPDFLTIESQPVRIEYTNSSGRSTHYHPDYLVTYRASSGRPPELFEIKSHAELQAKKLQYRDGFVAAHRYAAGRGWKFKVRTERRIRGPRLENLKRLKSHETHAPNELRLQRLIRIVREAESVTFGQVIEMVATTLQQRAEWLPTLWYAIAKNLICTELDTPISGRSVLWVPQK